MTTFNHKSSRGMNFVLREIVFGMEDGMVSTLGAVSGIAIGSKDHYTVLLAGCVIIAVESISMGIGSYLSNKASRDAEIKTIDEEKIELKTRPNEERRELHEMLLRDGWPSSLARHMTRYAGLNPPLMLREMQYRELGISPFHSVNPVRNAAYMFVSYIIGGFIPLISYVILDVQRALIPSVVITLSGLFALGMGTARYTGYSPVRSGLRVLILGGIALAVGLSIGSISSVLR